MIKRPPINRFTCYVAALVIGIVLFIVYNSHKTSLETSEPSETNNEIPTETPLETSEPSETNNAIPTETPLETSEPSETNNDIPTEISPLPKTLWQLPSPVYKHHDIEKNIFQTAKQELKREAWTDINPGYQYRFYSDDQSLAFIQKHLKGIDAIIPTLNTPVYRADLLRYLLLYIHGGIYSDSDTKCLVSIDKWLPGCSTDSMLYYNETAGEFQYTPREKRPAVGVILSPEQDWGIDNPADTWKKEPFHRVQQIEQWTLYSRSRHPLYYAVLQAVVRGLLNRTPYEIRGEFNVLQTTGPVIFTDTIRTYMLEHYHVRDIKQLIGHAEPFQIGDVLIAPPSAFSPEHFPGASTSGKKTPSCSKLVHHSFQNSWTHGP